ncbi:hypothetical protein BJ322DRAFT_476339 [Thelephora terrestris]|uniref:Uncharacterized protein n=1 Tax=Thelephora terrestris TaxID=56493 RepID=A0A9P6L1T6_9AGAM|nr:hypothetical protein BJ322DRAFT_476339 [Thelephora terrestris]
MANRSDVATHPQMSLPSFSQAFSSSSMNSISNSGNSLPPINSRSRPSSPPYHLRRVNTPPPEDEAARVTEQSRNLRKRTFAEASASSPDRQGRPQSPTVVRVKSEPDHDDQGSQPSSSGSNPRPHQQSWKAGISGVEASSSSALKPQAPSPTKRRRVTISGINTDVKRPSSDANTPISPVVIGFNLAREDSAAIEQVRSMLNVKLQQKALIEQRRNSTAGLTSPMVNTTPTIHIANLNGSDARLSNPRRHSMIPVHREPTLPLPPRNLTPPPSHSQSQASAQAPPQAQPQQLPPPQTQTSLHEISLARQPDSFGRRRASRLGKHKPADILISPREPNNDQIPTSIVSAPAHNTKFPMALPSLPPAMAGQTVPRVTSSIVPPTPTTLGGPRTAIPNLGSTNPASRRSPNHQVPISSNLIPQTPSSLKFNSSEKNAFLAPFEKFYDSLADSKQLKEWLNQQLQKSNTLVNALHKSEKLEEMVETMVEKRIAPMREEMYGLRRRVEELEHALRISSTQGPAPAPQSQSSSTGHTKGKVREPEPMATEATESYTFPASSEVHLSVRPDLLARKISPSNSPNSQGGSPVSFQEGRRLSVSSARLERRRSPPPTVERSQSHGSVPASVSSGPGGPKSSRSPTYPNVPLPKAETQRHHSHPSPSSGSQQQSFLTQRPADRRRELRDITEEPTNGSRSKPLLSPSRGARETREEAGSTGRRELISMVSQRSRRYSSSSEGAP